MAVTTGRLPMPPWLILFLLFVLVNVLIQPSQEGYGWWRDLRRPPRMRPYEAWAPVAWLGLQACIYGSALISWSARRTWPLLAAYLVLLVLIQGYLWVLSRTRQLGLGALVCLLGCSYGIGLTAVVQSFAPIAALWMMPYLVGSAVETQTTWQMRSLNR